MDTLKFRNGEEAPGRLPNNFRRRLEKYEERIGYASEKGIAAKVRNSGMSKNQNGRGADNPAGTGNVYLRYLGSSSVVAGSGEDAHKFADSMFVAEQEAFKAVNKIGKQQADGTTGSLMGQFVKQGLKIAAGYAFDTITDRVAGVATSALSNMAQRLKATANTAINSKLQWVARAWNDGLQLIDEGVQWAIERAAKATTESSWYKNLVEYNQAHTPDNGIVDPKKLTSTANQSAGAADNAFFLKKFAEFEEIVNKIKEEKSAQRMPEKDLSYTNDSKRNRNAEASYLDADQSELYEWMKEALGENVREDVQNTATKKFSNAEEKRNPEASGTTFDKIVEDPSKATNSPSNNPEYSKETSKPAMANANGTGLGMKSKQAPTDQSLKSKYEQEISKAFSANITKEFSKLIANARIKGEVTKAEALVEAMRYFVEPLELLAHAKDETLEDYDLLIDPQNAEKLAVSDPSITRDSIATLDAGSASSVSGEYENGIASIVQRLVYDRISGKLVGADKAIDVDGSYYSALAGIDRQIYIDKGERIVPLEETTDGTYTGNEERISADEINGSTTKGTFSDDAKYISIVRRLKVGSDGLLHEVGKTLAPVEGEYHPGLDGLFSIKRFIKGKGFVTEYLSHDEYNGLSRELAVNKIVSLLIGQEKYSVENEHKNFDGSVNATSPTKLEENFSISDDEKLVYLGYMKNQLGNNLLTIMEDLCSRNTYVRDEDIVSLVDINEIGCDVLNTASNFFAQTSLGQQALSAFEKYTDPGLLTGLYFEGVSKLRGTLFGENQRQFNKAKKEVVPWLTFAEDGIYPSKIAENGKTYQDQGYLTSEGLMNFLPTVTRMFSVNGVLTKKTLHPAVTLRNSAVDLHLTGLERFKGVDEPDPFKTNGELSYFNSMDTKTGGEYEDLDEIANSDYGIADLATNFRVNKTFVGGEIEYFKSGYYHFFFVKPDLNLTENHIHVMECEGYPRMCDVIPELSYDLRALEQTWMRGTFPPLMSKIDRSRAHPFFSYLLSNAIKGLSIPDYALESKEGFENMFGHRFSFGTTGRKSGYQTDFSINFYDTADLLILNIMKTWVKYIEVMYEGQADLLTNPMQTGNLDYLGALYYFVLEPDNQTIVHWGRYTGIYPTNVPFSSISMNAGSVDLPEFTVNFKSQWHEWNSLAVLQDFNYVMRGAGFYGRPHGASTDTAAGNYFSLGSITQCKNPSITADPNLFAGATVSENRALVQFVDLSLMKNSARDKDGYDHNSPHLRPYKYVLTFDSAKDFSSFNSSPTPIENNTYEKFSKMGAQSVAFNDVVQADPNNPADLKKQTGGEVEARALEYKSSGTDRSADDLDIRESQADQTAAEYENELRNAGATPTR